LTHEKNGCWAQVVGGRGKSLIKAEGVSSNKKGNGCIRRPGLAGGGGGGGGRRENDCNKDKGEKLKMGNRGGLYP